MDGDKNRATVSPLWGETARRASEGETDSEQDSLPLTRASLDLSPTGRGGDLERFAAIVGRDRLLTSDETLRLRALDFSEEPGAAADRGRRARLDRRGRGDPPHRGGASRPHRRPRRRHVVHARARSHFYRHDPPRHAPDGRGRRDRPRRSLRHRRDRHHVDEAPARAPRHRPPRALLRHALRRLGSARRRARAELVRPRQGLPLGARALARGRARRRTRRPHGLRCRGRQRPVRPPLRSRSDRDLPRGLGRARREDARHAGTRSRARRHVVRELGVRRRPLARRDAGRDRTPRARDRVPRLRRVSCARDDEDAAASCGRGLGDASRLRREPPRQAPRDPPGASRSAAALVPRGRAVRPRDRVRRARSSGVRPHGRGRASHRARKQRPAAAADAAARHAARPAAAGRRPHGRHGGRIELSEQHHRAALGGAGRGRRAGRLLRQPGRKNARARNLRGAELPDRRQHVRHRAHHLLAKPPERCGVSASSPTRRSGASSRRSRRIPPRPPRRSRSGTR